MGLDLTLTCKHCMSSVAEYNYTYNVASMWYAVVPEDKNMVEIDGMTGADSIPKLEKAIELLKLTPEKFTPMDPENGWGSYATFVKWLYKLLESAKAYPDCIWTASR